MKTIHVSTILFMLFSMTACDYFKTDRVVYAIEKEDYHRNISKDIYTHESYNYAFKTLDLCLKESHELNKDAIAEYQVRVNEYANRARSLLGTVRGAEKYGCIKYKESDFEPHEVNNDIYVDNGSKEKYEKLFN